MKKNIKGISMISLIVVIVSIIILSAIAITAGYRYINESRESEKNALTSMISDAAYRRQNDYSVDSKSYYAGSFLNEDQITSSNFELPENFSAEKTAIANKLNGAAPIWFVLDAESVKNLGVDGVEDYGRYIIDSFDSIGNNDSFSPVALVEYITGSTYLVEMKNSFKDSLNPSTHEHIWTVATCFEPMTCTICGATNGTKLPHDISPATCTQAEFCRRCGTVFSPAKGHDFADEYESDATRHWIICKNGCGTYKENAVHSKNLISIINDDNKKDDFYHKENCSICGWESAKTEHVIVIENDDATHHRRYCTLCDYDVNHSDSGWKYNVTEHWKNCSDVCGDEILKGNHEDSNDDLVCDICGKRLDYTSPDAFGANGIEIITKTTHQLEVRAKTQDNSGGLGIACYKFSIDDGNTWNTVNVTSDSQAATWKYENLVHNESYTIKVRVVDKADNYTDGSVTEKTYEVPSQLVASDLNPKVSTITSGSVNVTLSMPDLTLPQKAKDELKIVYKIDGISTDWVNYTTPITVTQEPTTVIYAKIVDRRVPVANSSNAVSTINVTNIDKTAPTVTIESTNTTETRTSHSATIKIYDEKSGIAAGTKIYYAWTTSTTEPTSYTAYKTVSEKSNEVSISIDTPAGVEGQYYLWVKSGVSDAVGNSSNQSVKSSTYFVVDDVAAELTERTMRNKESDKIDELFIRKGKKITINMKANKELSKGPLVQIITPAGTKEARATSTDRINWVATIEADDTFTEGLLNNVKFGDYVAISGKLGTEYTSTSDNKYVTYDNTLPALEYINK